MKKYLQYGSGLSCPPSFENFDASPTLRFEQIPLLGRLYTKNSARFPADTRFGDIVVGLPVPRSHFKGIYCSHVLEHLTINDFRTALRNTYSYLETGGTFRLVMPDLEHCCRSYLQDERKDASFRFLKTLYMRKETPARGLGALILERFGHDNHLWLWDYKATVHELSQVGFKSLRRASCGDSVDPVFIEAESEERWNQCLGIECQKVA